VPPAPRHRRRHSARTGRRADVTTSPSPVGRGGLALYSPGRLAAWLVLDDDAEVAESRADLVGHGPLLQVTQLAADLQGQLDVQLDRALFARRFGADVQAEDVEQADHGTPAPVEFGWARARVAATIDLTSELEDDRQRVGRVEVRVHGGVERFDRRFLERAVDRERLLAQRTAEATQPAAGVLDAPHAPLPLFALVPGERQRP